MVSWLAGATTTVMQVMALRKEVRTLQVELVQARLSGLAGFGGFGGGGDMGGGLGGGCTGSCAKAAGAVEEAAELRR